jgi:DNA-binding transcriptional LysR family regulator
MDLLWLRYFVAVAEELSFTKAALRFGIAQPPLSRHIQELEEAVGAQLFIRDRRHVELTDVGLALLPEARIAISAFEHALETAGRASRGEVGTIRIAMVDGLAEAVERVVTEHRKYTPDTKIEYSDIFSRNQSASLREHRVDVGFMRGPVVQQLNSVHLFSEQLYALLPPDHSLASKKSIALQEIAGESVLLHDPRISQIPDKVLELYAKAGVSTGPILYFTGSRLSPANQLRMRTEEHICFGTDTNRGLTRDRVPVTLDEADATYPVFFAWRKEEISAAVLGFVNSVRRVFQQHIGSKRKSVSQDKITSKLAS